jgi:hypothetical protein
MNIILRCDKACLKNLNAQLADGTRITFTIHRCYICNIFYINPCGDAEWNPCDISIDYVRLIRDGIPISTDALYIGNKVELRITNEVRRRILKHFRRFLGPVCVVCGGDAKGSCTDCRKVHYCGRKHQADHWETHQDECVKIDDRVEMNR